MVCISGAGIIGELCRQVIKLNPKEILIIDINEFNLYEINNELRADSKNLPIKAYFALQEK